MTTQTDDAPERLDANERDGRLIVAEHRGRYHWAAQLAHDLKVLDAGCGTGYGLQILADAGAAEVTGIDISTEAVAKASELGNSEHIEVLQGDLGELPFPDGEFDLVVCFEVIEHVPERDGILDELARVLGADGILCISTPNRLVYPPGNPYHIHEYEPEEFAQALDERFPHVALYRQTAWLASAILPDREFAAANESFPSRMIKAEPKEPGEEIFTVAVASRRELSKPQQTLQALLSLGEPFEVSWWQKQLDDGRKNAEALIVRTFQEAAHARERSLTSAKRVLDVEETLVQTNARIFALEQELDGRGEQISALDEQIERAQQVMSAMKTSLSWRITAPLRALKGPR
jgi:SAM-dependent methyltransferase